MITAIITSFNELKTIGKAISSIIDSEYSGTNEKLKLIVIAPDEETLSSAKKEVIRINFKNYEIIKDKGISKPNAINEALPFIQGDIVIFTDGDVNFNKGTVKALVTELRSFKNLGGVSGRQFSKNDKSTFFGYLSHLFAEALDKARQPLINGNQNNVFFPLSGYVMAIKSELLDFSLPNDVLVDDAYISYKIIEKGKKIGYTPFASANVGYPQNFSDYLKQKVRSTGGYLQLKEYGFFQNSNRGISTDFKMIFFPISYAKNLKELLFSLLIYPLRLYLWFKIYYLKLFRPQIFSKSWVQVASTK